MLRLQSGDGWSVTVTSVRVTSPVLVTVILNVAVPPIASDCVFGSLTMSIAGFDTGGFGITAGGTVGGVTVTGAESFAVTVWPFEPVPVAVATLVKFAVTLPERAVVGHARTRRHRGEGCDRRARLVAVRGQRIGDAHVAQRQRCPCW